MEANELFEAISHPIRIKILHLLSEKPLGFSELKRKLKIKSSGKLDFHIKKLGNLIKMDAEGKYTLTKHGYKALYAIKTIDRYGWQRRALYINILFTIIVNLYFAALSIEKWLEAILPITIIWITLYTYWASKRTKI